MASTSGISRRDVMKKGAVAGAIVWSAPILTSSPAFAATGRCSGSRPCVNFYYAKKELTKDCEFSSAGDESACRDLSSAASCDGSAVTLQNGCNVSGFSMSHTGTSATFNYPAGAVPIFIQLKPGAVCYSYEWNGTTGTNSFDNHSSDPGPGGQQPSASCQNAPTITTTGSLSTGFTVQVTGWPSSGTCNGISHVGTYFCL